jgi:Leucine-rich repeat (LRR) protein
VRSIKRLKRLAELLAHRIQHVHFSGELQFATLPEDVFALGELRSMNAVGKGLLELSPRIAELAFLRKLDLARNSLSSLPMALARLEELEELDLADNQLNTVIAVLRKMPGLRYCWLAGNPIAPEEIRHLRSELPGVKAAF